MEDPNSGTASFANSYFCSRRPYFISRLSHPLQPARLPFAGGQIYVVLAARVACGSKRPHGVGEVQLCFCAISFSISHLLLQSASIAAQQRSCIGAAFLVQCQASTLINAKFSAGRSIEKGSKKPQPNPNKPEHPDWLCELVFYVS